MGHGDEPQTGTPDRARGFDLLPTQAGTHRELILVENLGCEGADVRMQPPGFLQEQSLVLAGGLALSKQVAQGG